VKNLFGLATGDEKQGREPSPVDGGRRQHDPRWRPEDQEDREDRYMP
jgi:hypothetical protein